MCPQVGAKRAGYQTSACTVKFGLPPIRYRLSDMSNLQGGEVRSRDTIEYSQIHTCRGEPPSDRLYTAYRKTLQNQPPIDNLGKSFRPTRQDTSKLNTLYISCSILQILLLSKHFCRVAWQSGTSPSLATTPLREVLQLNGHRDAEYNEKFSGYVSHSG